jgi:hypothetical protein
MGTYHSAITHRSNVRPRGAVHHMVVDGPSSLDEQHVPLSIPMLLVLLLSFLLIPLSLPPPTFDAD